MPPSGRDGVSRRTADWSGTVPIGAEVGGGANASSGFVVAVPPGAGGSAEPEAFVAGGAAVVDAAGAGG